MFHFSWVHPSEAAKPPYASPAVILAKQNIVIDTIWTKWSSCSKCGKVGKRYRYGHCILVYKEKRQQSAIREAVSGKNLTKSVEITKDEIDLIKIFKNGITCQSYILPQAFKDLPEVKLRNTEIMIGYCKVRCPKAKVFEVKDETGKVLEVANNSAGVYSMLQPLPPLEPPIRRTVEYHNKGNKIVISCPGNLNSDAPVHWQMGGKNLIPELIKEKSEGRIFVSVLDKINIKDAKVADSNLYSCWQNDELAGTVQLVVERKIQMNLNHHMLFGVVVILSVFLYVFLKAFFGRKYAKTY